MTTDAAGTTVTGSKETGKKSASDAVKTYRYLRIALVALLGGIAVAVVVEFLHNGATCLQGSISAYYYTPVRAFLVSALVGLGVGLVAIRGVGWWEETFLNLAGMLAPVVAFVPTPGTGNCTSDPALKAAGPDAVFNNMTALFWMAPLGLLYVLLLRRLARRQGKPTERPQWGLLVPVGVLWAVALLLFAFQRDWFLEYGHGVAALLMFAFIVGVVALNGISLGRKEIAEGRSSGWKAYANRYTVIAVAMVVSFVVLYGYHRISGGWPHWVFAVEAALLALFLLFWTLQTEELWDEVVREGDPAAETARVDGRLVSPWGGAGSWRRGT
ncbi:MAG TPA: hypothetical protein VK402_14515 [Blastococcus sp.]|nr:hypothetical protein [Blastococcus sp.]